MRGVRWCRGKACGLPEPPGGSSHCVTPARRAGGLGPHVASPRHLPAGMGTAPWGRPQPVVGTGGVCALGSCVLRGVVSLQRGAGREGGTVPSGRRRCGVCPWCCPWWLPGARTPDVGTAPSHLGWGFLPAFLLLPSAPSLLPSPSFPPGVSSFLPSLKPRGPPGPPPPRSSFPAGTPLTASSPGLPPRPGMMLEVVPSLACPYLC